MHLHRIAARLLAPPTAVLGQKVTLRYRATEGLHPLEGKLENIDTLFDAGCGLNRAAWRVAGTVSIVQPYAMAVHGTRAQHAILVIHIEIAACFWIQ